MADSTECNENLIKPDQISKSTTFSVHTKIPTTEKVIIGAQRIADFVYYVFTQKRYPKWLKVYNPQFIQHMHILFIDGLTFPIFNEKRDLLPAFDSIEGNGFPLTVESPSKAGQLISGISHFLGVIKTKKTKQTFQSYQEMTAPLDVLFDYGFPLDGKFDVPGDLRCKTFKIEPLTDEEIKEYEMLPEKVENAEEIIALDCEMIETEFGKECARLSVTREDGTLILDQFFKPIGEVVDYLTDCSGITAEILEDAKATSFETVKTLAQFASRDTIIVGHSLENDFRSMKLIHKKVIDTTIIYNRVCQYPYKPSLELLYRRYIQKPFREKVGSHDSADDARATFDLVKYALKEAVHGVSVKPQIPTLFGRLKESIAQIDYFAPSSVVDYKGIDERIVCHTGEDTDTRLQSYIDFCANEKPTLSFLHFNDLATCELDKETEDNTLKKYNDILQTIMCNLLPNSILIVYTGSGNSKRIHADLKTKDPKHQHPGKDPERKEEFERCRRGICWIHCNNKK